LRTIEIKKKSAASEKDLTKFPNSFFSPSSFLLCPLKNI